MKIRSWMLTSAAAWMISGGLGREALASCGTLSLTIANVSVSWSESFTSQQVNFTINRTGSSSCSTFVTFSKGGGGSYSTRRAVNTANSSKTLPYQLYKTAALSATQTLQQLPDTSSNNNVVLPTTAFSGSAKSRTASYWVAIPYSGATTPTFVKYGTYQDTYQVKVYNGTIGGSSTLANTYNVTLTVTVPKISRISLVDTGSPFNSGDTSQTLNFGTLDTGLIQSFDMRMVTNAGYSISFSSQNNGVLKHVNAGITTTVPYTLTVNSVAKNLSTSASVPVQVASASGETDLSGANSPVTVTIGDTTDKVAGSYTDNIVITTATID